MSESLALLVRRGFLRWHGERRGGCEAAGGRILLEDKERTFLRKLPRDSVDNATGTKCKHHLDGVIWEESKRKKVASMSFQMKFASTGRNQLRQTSTLMLRYSDMRNLI